MKPSLVLAAETGEGPVWQHETGRGPGLRHPTGGVNANAPDGFSVVVLRNRLIAGRVDGRVQLLLLVATPVWLVVLIGSQTLTDGGPITTDLSAGAHAGATLRTGSGA